jgi:hypothetical protein
MFSNVKSIYKILIALILIYFIGFYSYTDHIIKSLKNEKILIKDKNILEKNSIDEADFSTKILNENLENKNTNESLEKLDVDTVDTDIEIDSTNNQSKH